MDAAPPLKGPRNPTIDGLKYVAAAGIVMHHTASYTTGALSAFLIAAPLSALFFFFAVAGYFHGPRGSRGIRWLGRRIFRLAVPYAIWSLLLLAWRAWQAGQTALPKVPAVDLVFFAGAHGILWTLPMLAYCAIVAELVARTPVLRRVLIGVSLVLTLVIYWSNLWGVVIASPLVNFLLAPRWLLAYAAGMEIRSLVPGRPPRFALYLVPLAIVGVGLLRLGASLLYTPVHTTVESALWIGTALLVLWGAHNGLRWYGIDRLAWGSTFLIGVYVTHVVWLQVFARFLPPATVPSYFWIPAAWSFALAAATATVAVLKSNAVTRVAVV